MWVEECDPQDFWVFLLLSFPWQSTVKQRTPCSYFLLGKSVRFLCGVNLSEWKWLLKAAGSGASWLAVAGFCLWNLEIGAIVGIGRNLLISELDYRFWVNCDQVIVAASPHSKEGFVFLYANKNFRALQSGFASRQLPVWLIRLWFNGTQVFGDLRYFLPTVQATYCCPAFLGNSWGLSWGPHQRTCQQTGLSLLWCWHRV